MKKKEQTQKRRGGYDRGTLKKKSDGEEKEQNPAGLLGQIG